MLNIFGKNGKSTKKTYLAVSVLLLTIIVIAGSLYYAQPGEVTAAIQKSKVLIISNNDTYYTVSGGTSASAMATVLTNNGFDVTQWIESANGNAPPTVAYANNFDVVIFTQGVGYRNTNNGRNGLNLNDLNFLKQYLNLTSSGNKSRLIIEGEDVMSDILRVGTSTDQRDVLKITTSSSADNYGRMTNLRITDTAHPIFNYIYPLTTDATGVVTNYQTSYQDYVAANLSVGAQTTAQAKFNVSSTYRTTINTWSDSAGGREVYMPFAWYVNASNGIADQTFRERLLINMVSWVGERKINVSAYNIASDTVSPSETMGMLAAQISPESTSPSYTFTPPAIKGLSVKYIGDMDAAQVSGNITAYVYSDTGTIGTLEAGDTLLGTGTFSGGIAAVNFDLEINSTKNLIVAYRFGAGTPLGKTAGARLENAESVIMHDWDKLTRAYPRTFTVESTQTMLSAGGTAQIKTPADGSTVRSNVALTGTASTSYNLKYATGYNNRSVDENQWVQFHYGSSPVNNFTLGTWNSAMVPEGQYTVRLYVYSGAVAYRNLYVDNTAPTLSNVSHSNVHDNYVTISWTTNESSTSEVVYRVSPAGVWQTFTDSAKVLNHMVQLNGLMANTDYEYKVKSTDAAGNTSAESPVQTFKTLDQGPFASITYPAVIAQMAPRVGGSVQIRGSALTSNPGHSVVYSVYYGYGTLQEDGETPDRITDWTLIHSAPGPINSGVLASWNTPATEGSYVLWLRVEDPALSGLSAVDSDYVQVVVDNTNPEITGFGVHNVSNVSACVYWETSKNTTDQVLYGFNPGVYPNVINDTDKDRMGFLYPLQANKTYYYKVVATDATGHVVETPEQSFKTLNITGDATPPVVSAVYLTAAGRTETTVDLRWSAAVDNSGIAAYKMFYSTDGETYSLRGVIPGIKLTYTDTGLSPNTAYWYYLTVVDAAGNESVPTAAIKVDTMANSRVNPHGAYTKLTSMCSKCHTTHMGKKEFLFNRTQEATMCYTCHDAAGTGSKYAIEAEYTPDHTSRHPLPMENTSKECASCHNPHLNPVTYPRLLYARNSVTGTVYSSGNNFCYVCHGVQGPDRILDNTAGAHDVFETSIHNSSNFPAPESGSGVKCELCHENHASADVRLTKAPEEENCYHCHGDSSDQYGIENIKKNLNRLSYHNVTGNQSTGRVECVNCHNPHYVGGGALNTSDPYNTITTWPGDRSTFCIKCHDGDALPVKHVDRNVNVPYSVYFPTTALNLTTVSSTDTNGGWNKSLYVDSNSIHYNWNSTNRVQCTQCHDPHGSNAKRLLARDEDTDSSASTGICVNCHSDSGVWKSVYTSAPAIFLELTNASSHPVFTVDGTNKHSDTEDYANISVANRHAECWDCHDPHLARRTGTKTGNLSGPLYNVSGVTRSGASLVWQNPATEDWQVCYKCHSSYWNNLSSNTTGSQRDIAAEFYRTNANRSYHFVELQSNPNMSSANVFNASRITGTNKDGVAWSSSNTKMYCQDCHGTPSGAKGPHGSIWDGLLKGTYYTFTETTRAGTDDRLLCFNCHNRAYYESSTSTTHDIGKDSDHNKPCWWCHGSRVHGTNKNHLIIIRNTGVPAYHPDYEAYGVMDSRTLGDPTQSSKMSCRTNVTGCTDHN